MQAIYGFEKSDISTFGQVLVKPRGDLVNPKSDHKVKVLSLKNRRPVEENRRAALEWDGKGFRFAMATWGAKDKTWWLEAWDKAGLPFNAS